MITPYSRFVLMLLCIALLAPCAKTSGQLIELRKFDDSDPDDGVFLRYYSAGANVTITNTDGLGQYLIRSTDSIGQNNDPSIGVGTVTVSVIQNGEVFVHFVEKFGFSGIPYAGVLNCGGVVDQGASSTITRTGGSLKGSLTGNVDVDHLSLQMEGDVSGDLDILGRRSISSLIARSIGGGTTIRCFGDSGGLGITTIRAGWDYLSNPNGHTIGAAGDPVTIRADYVAGQDITTVHSYGDMYANILCV